MIILLPSKTIATIDQMDAGMDLLRTAHAALQDQSGLDGRLIESIANSLGAAIETLEPVRSVINKAHGGAP